MESEAAFNDATGAIAFSSIIALAIGSSGYAIAGTYNSGSFLTSRFPTISNSFVNLSFIIHVEHFIVIFFGGSAIGLGIAAATHRLHTLMNDPLSETSLTIATVFGSVVLANTLGVSGLVAVAVAGLYFGNVTVKKEAIMSKNVNVCIQFLGNDCVLGKLCGLLIPWSKYESDRYCSTFSYNCFITNCGIWC